MEIVNYSFGDNATTRVSREGERKLILRRTWPFPQATKGMSKVHGFLDSLGVYGPTPFIASMYGAGELCQAFCRYVVVKRRQRRGHLWSFFVFVCARLTTTSLDSALCLVACTCCVPNPRRSLSPTGSAGALF